MHYRAGLRARGARKTGQTQELPPGTGAWTTSLPALRGQTVNQGILWQQRDFGDPDGTAEWQIVSQRPPTEQEWQALRFAWKACQHVKSNAIVLVHPVAERIAAQIRAAHDRDPEGGLDLSELNLADTAELFKRRD